MYKINFKNDISFFQKFYNIKKLPLKNVIFSSSVIGYENEIIKKITNKKRIIIVSDKTINKIYTKNH